jgi:Ni/Fe-hydrogenase 1 B-type cytochrome subunit
MSATQDRFIRRYIWEPVVRWYHWVNVLCMFILTITGYYISYPFVNVTGLPFPYITGIARFVHFVSATILAISLIVRLYWAFVGNRFARWEGMLPLNKERLQDLWKQFKYYAFLSSERPCYVGHNPIAGLSYAALWLLTIIQGITGLALNAEVNPGGFWWTWFGWLFGVSANQTVRLIHHSLMWVFIIFFLIHLYMAILDDIEERDGILSSIVNGVKWPHCPESVEDRIAKRKGNNG